MTMIYTDPPPLNEWPHENDRRDNPILEIADGINRVWRIVCGGLALVAIAAAAVVLALTLP